MFTFPLMKFVSKNPKAGSWLQEHQGSRLGDRWGEKKSASLLPPLPPYRTFSLGIRW